ncbi:acidic mammalian chitinase [Culicoides brevitarsis]|uniref:acidic mammalian chitinase n=1 Tax=Culicoides brevitarsis TaxID=469753 RepID=UPI00307B8F1B
MIRNSTQRSKYSPLKENYVEPTNSNVRQIINICLLFVFSGLCVAIIFITWTFNENVQAPPHKLTNIPSFIVNRSSILSQYLATLDNNFSIPTSHHLFNGTSNSNSAEDGGSVIEIKQLSDSETLRPSKFGNFISSKVRKDDGSNGFRLVCYYAVPDEVDSMSLKVTDIEAELCTHLNIGVIDVQQNALVLTDKVRQTLRDVKALKVKNKDLKVLLWVGAAYTGHFSEMVHNHANRKMFIRSLKATLEEFRIDGIDLDWEFPNGMTNERIHFAQLLHEIRREYQREHRTYLLSLAVAAPSVLVDMTYDVREINNYVDFVNIMTYDFNFYSKQTPWTGLNSPLYKRHSEGSVLAMLNINYSVNYWEQRGLERSKIVIGLPTYAHTYKLVNPFNTKIGSPAEGNGFVGQSGFASYSEVCWFQQSNLFVTVVYDVETCSPYMYAGTEWISFENERSLECKVKFIRSNNYGGAMVFSLNTDDTTSTCLQHSHDKQKKGNLTRFPLVQKVKSILFN